MQSLGSGICAAGAEGDEQRDQVLVGGMVAHRVRRPFPVADKVVAAT